MDPIHAIDPVRNATELTSVTKSDAAEIDNWEAHRATIQTIFKNFKQTDAEQLPTLLKRVSPSFQDIGLTKLFEIACDVDPNSAIKYLSEFPLEFSTLGNQKLILETLSRIKTELMKSILKKHPNLQISFAEKPPSYLVESMGTFIKDPIYYSAFAEHLTYVYSNFRGFSNPSALQSVLNKSYILDTILESNYSTVYPSKFSKLLLKDFKVPKMNTEMQKEWVSVLLMSLYYLSSTVVGEKEMELLRPLFRQVVALNDPFMRMEILKLLAAKSYDHDQLIPRVVKHLSETSNAQSTLPNFLMAFLESDDVQYEPLLKYLNALVGEGKSNLLLKDAAFLKVLLRTLLALIEHKNLNPSQKLKILETALNYQIVNAISALKAKKGSDQETKPVKKSKGTIKISVKKEELIRALTNLSAILNIINSNGDKNAVEHLKKAESAQQFPGILEKAFKKLIPIGGDIPNFESRFKNTFGSFRNPNAIFIYGSLFHSFPDVASDLARCVEEVLMERFPACRYEGSPHLEIAFQSPELKEGWQSNFAIPLEDILPVSITKNSSIDFHKGLRLSFAQHHAQAENYPFLYAYLSAVNETEKISAKEKLFQEETSHAHTKLQQLLVQLAEGVEDPLKIVQEAIPLLPARTDRRFASEFEADIKSYQSQIIAQRELAEQSRPFEGWTIGVTDDICDLFLCGTEVPGSCQRIAIDATPELNKCLLAYVMDGKIKLVAIKGSDGRIQARSILRLLLNEETKQPVLFLERIYPSTTGPLLEAIVQIAKTYAQKLNIPLVSTEVGHGNEYGANVESLSGQRFEYVDAGQQGVMPDGRYTIKSAHML